MKCLVTCCKDWADEFDINGFAIYESKQKWFEDVEKFKNAKQYESFWFGTNEGWESDQVKEEAQHWFNDYEVKEITDEEVDVIVNAFGLSKDRRGNIRSFGKCPCPLDLIAE